MAKILLTGKLLGHIREGRFLFFCSIIERIFFFIFFVLLARQLEVADYGRLITGFTIANILALLLDLGIPIHLQKEISSGKDAGKLFSSVLLFELLSAPVFFAASASAGIYLFEIDLVTMLLITAPVLFFSLSNILGKALAGTGDFRSQFVALVISRFPALLPVIILYLNNQLSVNGYLQILLAASAVQFAYLALKMYKPLTSSGSIRANFSDIKSLYAIIPLGAAVIFNFLYDKVDVLIISKLLGFEEAAIYNIAYGMFKTASISFTFLLIPALSRISYSGRRKSAVRLVLARYTWLIFLICIVTALILAALSGFLTEIIYGSKYAESALYLRILSIALVFMGLNNLMGVALNGLGLYRQNLYVTVAGLAANVLINLLLITEMGILGAVIATIATELLVLALDSYAINNYLHKEST